MHVFLPQTFLLTYVTGYWPTYTKAVHGLIAIKKKKRQRAKEKLVTFRRKIYMAGNFTRRSLLSLVIKDTYIYRTSLVGQWLRLCS